MKFSHSCKPVAQELAPKLAVIIRHLVNGGRFSVCWRLADVVPVPKNFFLRNLETSGLALLFLSYQLYLKVSGLGS